MSFWKFLRNILGFDCRHYDAVITVFPVNGSGNLVVSGQLKRVDDPQNLIKVPACRSGIGSVSYTHLTMQTKA